MEFVEPTRDAPSKIEREASLLLASPGGTQHDFRLMTAPLDWSQCPAVESVPGRRSGAWVFKDTRMPISAVFENLQDMSVDELIEEFGVTRAQVESVLQFAALSAEAPEQQADAHSL